MKGFGGGFGGGMGSFGMMGGGFGDDGDDFFGGGFGGMGGSFQQMQFSSSSSNGGMSQGSSMKTQTFVENGK